MPEFKIHETSNSSGPRQDSMKRIEKFYGRMANVLGAMAESPAALDAYHGLACAMKAATFTPTERHVVWFTINLEHGCHYCMAAHTPHAIQEDVAEDIIATARRGGNYEDPRLEALRTFTLAMVRERGWVSKDQINAFLDAGFSRENIFEIITAIAHKVMTNYTNHIVEPPLDEMFKPHAWSQDNATLSVAE